MKSGRFLLEVTKMGRGILVPFSDRREPLIFTWKIGL